jgi:apolipoprotein N-acyltransferase
LKRVKISQSHVFCVISGITTAIGFAFPSCGFLIWFSLIPCIYTLLDIKNKNQAFFTMFLFGMSFYLCLFTWLWGIYPMNWLGFSTKESLALLSFAWLGLSLFEALFPALLGILFYKLRKLFNCDWLLITLLWIIMEWAQGSGPLGLTWGRLANSQYNNSYIIQGASLFGSLFVSGLLVLANALIACYLYNRNSHKYIIGFLVIFIINFSFGYYRINTKKNYTETTHISIIQTNINSKEKWISNNVDSILENYIELTELACNNSADQINTVIWSETAIPIPLTNHKEILDKCRQLSNSINATILVGSFDSIDNDTFNTIFKISPFSDEIETYYKQNLVPFGEYLPFRDIFEKSIPILSNINAGTSDLTAGKNINIFNTKNGIIANLICFDSIFPEIARQQVLKGANIIAVESNDSWFNKTAAKHQHLSQAVLRAVENNRYVMRCANGSISAAISPTGQIVSALQSESDGYINYEVSLIPDKTLYTLLGDSIVFISMLIILALLIAHILVEIIIYPIAKKVKFLWSTLTRK